MLYPEIRELYKYYPPDIERIECIEGDNLYFSSTASFNDPFDGKINIVSDYDANKYVYSYVQDNKIDITRYDSVIDLMKKLMLDKNGKLKREIKKEYEQKAQSWKDIISKTAISSFTTENDSILMWSHYAKSNSGFCVGYRRVGYLGNDRFCFPVNYSDFYPTIHIVDFVNDSRSFLTYFGTKSLKWSYEKEWRAISQDEGINSEIKVLASKIILGSRCSENIKNRILRLANKKKIATYQAYCSQNEYKLKIKKI